MASLDQISSLIRPLAKGAPEPTINQAIIRAAREFCAESWWLRRDIALPTVVGQQPYVLVLPSPYADPEEILHVVSVKEGAEPFLNPSELEDHSDPAPDNSTPVSFTFEPPTGLTLYPPPDEIVTLRVRVAVQPKLAQTTLDDGLVRHYDRVLAQGALAHMLMMKEESWYDPKLSMQYSAMFNSGIGWAKIKAQKGNTNRETRVRIPNFVSRGSRIGR